MSDQLLKIKFEKYLIRKSKEEALENLNNFSKSEKSGIN